MCRKRPNVLGVIIALFNPRHGNSLAELNQEPMKIGLQFPLVILIALIWLKAPLCRAAVSLTVTPSAVGNSYSGSITLNITGLTNGESVKVQTYLDLNSNGVVDAGEPLIDVFNLTDGGVSTIGGVTNISVPFDSNSTTGAITTTLSFAPTLENVVGQKIYRVVSNPTGAFTPVTATLSVTNTALAQSVSGTVYSNGTAPLANAVVVALTATNTSYVAATVANASGNYFLTLPTGSYVLMPALPGYFADQSLLPLVTLTNGASATNNLSLTNGPVSISGQVVDAGNSNVVGGVFLQAQANSYFAITFTDTNGDYTLGVTSNNWKIDASPERLSRRGYVTPQGYALKVNATLGDVTNANFGLYKGNALFYGQLTVTNTPVANVVVQDNDSDALFSGKSYTDANGNYAVVALVDTNVLGTNDYGWSSTADLSDGGSGPTLLNFIFNQASGTQGLGVPLTNGEAYLNNLVGLPIDATISGHLVNNQGTPLSGVSVGASASIHGLQYVTTFVETDANGDYSVGAADGQWYVSANNTGSGGLSSYGDYDPQQLHWATIPPTNPVVNITAYPIGTPFLSEAEKISSTQFGFNLIGSAGYNYTIQASTSLASSNWFNIITITNFSGSELFINDYQATNSARFYRVFQGP